MTLTIKQWAAATAALWVVLIANWFLLDGVAYHVVGTFLLVGFLALLVDRHRNLKTQRRNR